CNVPTGSAFASVAARKGARRQNQERPHGEPDPVPVREGVVWMREDEAGALQLRRSLRVQEHLPLRRGLRLRRHEVVLRGRREGGVPSLPPCPRGQAPLTPSWT